MIDWIEKGSFTVGIVAGMERLVRGHSNCTLVPGGGGGPPKTNNQYLE